MPNGYFVEGSVADAPFTLKIHRGEGMALLAMNWKGTPPDDFVGFAIESAEPGATQFFPLKNRLTFDGNATKKPGASRPETYSTFLAPIQKFRWVHFPYRADLDGAFQYRVTPMYMDATGALRPGTAQTAQIVLARETYPDILNVAFTRGFVSSQAFVDRYDVDTQAKLDTLLPATADEGLTFKPSHPKAKDAYGWMGFEARKEILLLLDDAIADPTAHVGIVAFDLNLPEIVDRVLTLGKDRVRVIIDNSPSHVGGAEDAAAMTLEAAGIQVVRQAMGSLQHNKTLYATGKVQRAICGSTNLSWRGWYVQSNNVLVCHGAASVKVFETAFEQYWTDPALFKDSNFPSSVSAGWTDLGLSGIDARIAFSPHSSKNSVLASIGADISTTTSSVLYSLAFLAITPGVIRDALAAQTNRNDRFVAGISDMRAGIVVTANASNRPPTYVAALDKATVPEPFRSEPSGLVGDRIGTRMHHKFIVLDFDRPSARVYLGSYNMSKAADRSNGENLVLIRDRRVATSYMVEAVRLFDHYQFRAALKAAKTRGTPLKLLRPPAAAGDMPWWRDDYDDARKIKDRDIFA